ncbi:DsbA family protein [Herbiconiux sp.]|uniref:DsbA family oxidoreductase n=1 Tax=Herbiconiux sp. TaxID=1871186 RepID=UPI00344B8AAF
MLWIVTLQGGTMEDMDTASLTNASPTPAIKVDIWSDVQCGWCYIAKRRLEAAVERFGGGVEIEYHSFELAPEAPAEFDGATKEFLNHYREFLSPRARRCLHGSRRSPPARASIITSTAPTRRTRSSRTS